MKKISIIVPVYKEKDNVLLVYEAVNKVFTVDLDNKYAWELVFVDDGSPDNSWAYLQEANEKDPGHVFALKFARNFGKEIALSAGLDFAKESDAIICLDCDMQHPPELIPSFIKKWEEGSQVVIGIRKKVADYSFIKKIGSRFFYKIMNYFSEIKIEPNSTDFRLMDKTVVEAFTRFSESSRMFRGLVDWLGFERSFIEFEAPARAGEDRPSYSIKKLIRLAIDSIVSFSWLPLRITGYLGALVTALSGLTLFFMLISHLLVPGLYTLQAYFIVFITFLIGIVLCSIGFTALYIEQIHRQVLQRPLYIISKKLEESKNV